MTRPLILVNGSVRMMNEAEYEDYLTLISTSGPLLDPVPASVTMAQARRALLREGLLDDVQVAVDAAGGEAAIAWEYATNVYRDSQFISTIGPALDLTDEQIDDLFRLAASIND